MRPQAPARNAHMTAAPARTQWEAHTRTHTLVATCDRAAYRGRSGRRHVMSLFYLRYAMLVFVRGGWAWMGQGR